MLEGNNLKILIIFLVLIISIIIWLMITIRSIKLKKRISDYVINNNIEDVSILGKVEKKYISIRKRLMRFLRKYIKFKDKTKEEKNEELIFISNKILLSIIFLFGYLVLSIITFTKPLFVFAVLSLLIGYLIPIIKKEIDVRISKKLIERDLLKAISLINSSLQSGKSIIQAISVVGLELDGPIALEFKKIEKDLENGLSLFDAFTRFEKRVNLEEVEYITTSLFILNQTGGNIISIFSSIEEIFYTRGKLDSELKATISSSKLVFDLLVCLPFIIYLLIGLFNPNYFIIFFKSGIGLILFTVIVLIYILYIIIIKNIMKVEKY